MKNTLLGFLFLISFSASFSQVDLTNGLVAYYPFTGNANDVSGNANNPVFNNTTLTADQFGTANSACHFDGSSTYIRILNSASLNTSNQISLCAIVKVEGFYSGPCHGNDIMNKGQYANNPNSFFMRFDDFSFTNGMNCSITSVDDDHQNFYGWNLSPPMGYTPYIQKNQWYCVVYTYDGTTARLYVDGTLKSQSAEALNFNNSHDLFLGRLFDPNDPSSFPYWFNGTMDEVRIYNRAINSLEVSTLCNLFALPVALTDFEANIVDKQIKLNWDIENEGGIRNYTVERSLIGHSDFMPIGKIAPGNIHLYSFVDNNTEVNRNYYYRLAIVENSGAINYSEIKTAKIIAKNKLITVYPNPSRGGTITVRINGYNGNAKFTILNSLGEIILQKSQIIIDNNPLPVTLNKQSKGIYWLKVETNNETSVERIVIF